MDNNIPYTKLDNQNNDYVPSQQPSQQPPPQQPYQTQYFQNQQYNSPYPQYNNSPYPQQQQAYYAQPTPPQVGFSSTTSVSVAAPCKKAGNGDNDVIPAVVLFVLGFFFYIPWIINIMYCKSKSGLARGFAIASVVFFFIGIVFTVIYLIVFFVFIDKVAHDMSNTVTVSSSSGWSSSSISTSGHSCYYSSSC